MEYLSHAVAHALQILRTDAATCLASSGGCCRGEQASASWLRSGIPARAKRGQIPAGTAKCSKGIPTKPEAYPEEYSWTEGATPAEGVLRVGAGEFAPVSRAVWEFSVSGYEVLRGWPGFRMKQRSGRKGSPLDDLRPAAWTAALTTELLELLWVLEATVAAQPQLNGLLSEILAGLLLTAADFPAATATGRAAPGEEPEQAQPELEM